MSLAKLEQLSIRFDNREVLSQIDLTIKPGAQVGLVGESGSGKSLTALTLMNLLPERAHATGQMQFEFEESHRFDAAQWAKISTSHFAERKSAWCFKSR